KIETSKPKAEKDENNVGRSKSVGSAKDSFSRPLVFKSQVTFATSNDNEKQKNEVVSPNNTTTTNGVWASGLPPLPKTGSEEHGGLPTPVYDDEENENTNDNKEVKQFFFFFFCTCFFFFFFILFWNMIFFFCGLGREQEKRENQPKPISPVIAAINGFDFEAKKKMSLTDLNEPDYHLSSNQIKTVPKGTPKLGKLKRLPPKQQKFQKQDNKISDVTSVERTTQVIYDEAAGMFYGLPKEWEELLNKQFGVSPKHLPGVKLPQYTAKIPKVLVVLKERLVEANGYQQVGIFRLAPDARDNNAVKSSIDSGKFQLSGNDRADVNVYANLIKVWFRDLPDPLLNCVAPERVEMANKEEDVVKIIADFPEPQKSIFLWLCDMCVECAVHENVNKMGPKVIIVLFHFFLHFIFFNWKKKQKQNLAIVIGPNLFNTTKFENPMKAMTYSAKVVDFFEKAIKWRQSH
ncbi:RhoGAP domain-containing protein, partial [Reticulomyxa filosa]